MPPAADLARQRSMMAPSSSYRLLFQIVTIGKRDATRNTDGCSTTRVPLCFSTRSEAKSSTGRASTACEALPCTISSTARSATYSIDAVLPRLLRKSGKASSWRRRLAGRPATKRRAMVQNGLIADQAADHGETLDKEFDRVSRNAIGKSAYRASPSGRPGRLWRKRARLEKPRTLLDRCGREHGLNPSIGRNKERDGGCIWAPTYERPPKADFVDASSEYPLSKWRKYRFAIEAIARCYRKPLGNCDP